MIWGFRKSILVFALKFKIIGLSTSLVFVLLIFILFDAYEINQISPNEIENTKILNVEFLKKNGSYGKEIGQFDNPRSLEFFNNQLFVLDSGNNRVQVFSNNLDFESVINLPIQSKNPPQGIAVTNDRIFVVYTYDYEIKIFDYNGKILGKFPVSWTTDLIADENFLYVLEPHAKSIQVYDHFGVLVKQFDAHENVHYLNSNKKNLIASGPHPSVNIAPEILIYDKNSGTLEQRFPTTGLESFSAITEDNIFFLEFDTIKVLDFNGNLVYEHDMERGIDSVIRHSQIEINDNIVYVSDTIDNSIKILKIIYE